MALRVLTYLELMCHLRHDALELGGQRHITITDVIRLLLRARSCCPQRSTKGNK